MAWVFLILAGICEIIGVLFMKVATEKKGWAPKVILIANFGVSFFFLSLAMNTLPMGELLTRFGLESELPEVHF
ncbi:small Multidrug Resistance family protein [Bacillus anthracis]|nr:small Multidrug Resistance family protein [Bacillus anthracis]